MSNILKSKKVLAALVAVLIAGLLLTMVPVSGMLSSNNGKVATNTAEAAPGPNNVTATYPNVELIQVRFYNGAYDSSNPTTGLVGATIVDARQYALDNTKNGYWGTAFWNDASGGYWRVAAATDGTDQTPVGPGTFYAAVEDIIEGAGEDLAGTVSGFDYTDYWKTKSTLYFETTDSPAFYSLYNSTYEIVHDATRVDDPNYNGTPNMYQGWATDTNTKIFTKGANEPVLQGVGPYTTGAQPSAVLGFNAISTTIAAGDDAKDTIDGTLDDFSNLYQYPRYLEGSYDGADINDSGATWGRRFPSRVTTLIISLG